MCERAGDALIRDAASSKGLASGAASGCESLGTASDGMAVESPWPYRPFVPTPLLALVSWVVVAQLVLRGFIAWQLVAAPLALCAAGAGCAAVAGNGRFRRVAVTLVAMVAAGIVSFALSARSLAATDARAAELGHLSVSSLELSVVGDATETGSGWFLRATVRLPSGEVASVWVTSPERLGFGELVRGIGRFSPNEDDEWGVSSRARGVSGRVRLVRVTERVSPGGPLGALMALRARALERIGPEESEARALMAGAIVADRTQLKAQGTEDAFSRVGLSHLVAVSGSHLVVVGAGLEALLLALGAGPRFRAVGVLALAGAYVALCASPASAVRSWVMLAASLAGRGFGRRGHGPSGMAIAGLSMCALDPTCACDLGFVLSALSVCALSLFASHAEALLVSLGGGVGSRVARAFIRVLPDGLTPAVRRALGPCGRVVRSARSTLAASLVCQVATLPACAVTFGVVSPVAPLANVVVGPLFGPIVTLGVTGCAVAPVPLVGDALVGACTGLCALAVWLTRLCGTLPLASVPVSLGPAAELAPLAVAAVWYAWWPRPSTGVLRWGVTAGALGTCALAMGLVWLVPPQIVVLDVGQGDAILVRDGPHAVLVDTGPGDAVVDALARQHVYGLEAVVLTHGHADHVGGLDDLVGLVGVGAVYTGVGGSGEVSGEVATAVGELTGEGARELPPNGAVRVGRFRLTCLWPAEPVSGAENEHSVVLLATYEGTALPFGLGERRELTALLTGDAEQDVLGEVAARAGDIDLLKVGHHGSRVSVSSEEAAALDPEVAVASAGEGNSYGHPTPECRETLERAGAVFLSTIDSGDVTVLPGASGPRVLRSA